MVSITINAELAEQLARASGAVEIRDAAGNVVGHFQPAHDRSAPARTLESFDIDEIRRRERSGGPTYTTAEVLEHLDSLDAD